MAEAKKTTPKVPQDRKKKAVVVDVTKTPGWDLLRDMTDIPVWEQTPLINLVQSAYEKSDDDGGVDMQIIGDIAQAMRAFAIDEAAYIKFVSGAGALQRAMNLAMVWVGQMGEFEGSES